MGKKEGPDFRPALKEEIPRGDELLDLLVKRVALQVGIVLLLLDALRHGFLVPLREVTGGGFAFLLRFSAFQGDDFLHRI